MGGGVGGGGVGGGLGGEGPQWIIDNPAQFSGRIPSWVRDGERERERERCIHVHVCACVCAEKRPTSSVAMILVASTAFFKL